MVLTRTVDRSVRPRSRTKRTKQRAPLPQCSTSPPSALWITYSKSRPAAGEGRTPAGGHEKGQQVLIGRVHVHPVWRQRAVRAQGRPVAGHAVCMPPLPKRGTFRPLRGLHGLRVLHEPAQVVRDAAAGQEPHVFLAQGRQHSAQLHQPLGRPIRVPGQGQDGYIGIRPQIAQLESKTRCAYFSFSDILLSYILVSLLYCLSRPLLKCLTHCTLCKFYQLEVHFSRFVYRVIALI